MHIAHLVEVMREGKAIRRLRVHTIKFGMATDREISDEVEALGALACKEACALEEAKNPTRGSMVPLEATIVQFQFLPY